MKSKQSSSWSRIGVWLVVLVGWGLVAPGCSSDLGIERVQFQCAEDGDCGDGLTCRAGLCTDEAQVEQQCSDYCDTFLQRCASSQIEALFTFRDKPECMEVCRTYPTNGEEGDTTGNTLQCRAYHLEAAASDASTHCPHASARGVQFCGDTDRKCLSYCFQLMDTCTGGNRQFDTPQGCLSACSEYRRGGVIGENGDTLECRLGHLADAIEGVEVELNPSDDQVKLNQSAVEAILAEDYEKAAGLLEASLELGQLNVTWLNLGRAYQKLGRCDEARKAYLSVVTAPAVDEPPRRSRAWASTGSCRARATAMPR